MAQGPRRGFFSRGRSLDDFNRKFGKDIVQKTIEEVLESKNHCRVLEIGCGEGRILMELRKLYPNIELFGINKKPWAAMKGSQSLKRTGTFYKIFSQDEIRKAKLPKIDFYYARNLKFPDNYFDLILSQVSIQYIDRKDTLIEDVWRVLKKGRSAFLNIDTYQDNFPDFLEFATPRFIIYKHGRVYPIRNLVKDLRKDGYDITYRTYIDEECEKNKKRINLTLHKNKASKLNLGLQFDQAASFDLRLLKKEVEGGPILGYRSVYRIE